MKLQKQKTDYQRNYSKYVLVIPENIISSSGFKEGDELKADSVKGKIILTKE